MFSSNQQLAINNPVALRWHDAPAPKHFISGLHAAMIANMCRQVVVLRTRVSYTICTLKLPCFAGHDLSDRELHMADAANLHIKSQSKQYNAGPARTATH